jgi:hypothetical protein
LQSNLRPKAQPHPDGHDLPSRENQANQSRNETTARHGKPFALVPYHEKDYQGSSICAFSKKLLKAENIAKHGSITQQAVYFVQSPCAGQQPYTNNMCHTEQQAMQPPQKMQLSMELPTQTDEKIPAPHGHGTFYVESFADYVRRWPECYSQVPETVVETWIYRHWNNFQAWLPLAPLSWEYVVSPLSNEDILRIEHIGNWPETLESWGNDLFDGASRKKTWLGRYMLASGTTPSPIIVARNADAHIHPRERKWMRAPYQLIEGHMRIAYLQAMIRREYEKLKPTHIMVIATIPTT